MGILAALMGIAAAVLSVGIFKEPAIRVSYDSALPHAGKSAAPTEAERDDHALPAGLSPLTPPETFDANTLSDKINGKAELYLSAGFVKLETRRYAEKDRPDRWLESYVYDMGQFRNAFSVFSLQRRQNAVGQGPGPISYAVESGVFFVHGKYYVEIVASNVSGSSLDLARALAEGFVRRTPVPGEAMEEPALFPAEDLVSGSIALIASDAFGCEFMDQIFTAAYRSEGKEVTAFLSRRKGREEAAELAGTYHRFLLENGGKALPGPADIAGGRLVEILGAYELVFSRGAFVAGIHDCADAASAARIAGLLDAKLRGAPDGS